MLLHLLLTPSKSFLSSPLHESSFGLLILRYQSAQTGLISGSKETSDQLSISWSDMLLSKRKITDSLAYLWLLFLHYPQQNSQSSEDIWYMAATWWLIKSTFFCRSLKKSGQARINFLSTLKQGLVTLLFPSWICAQLIHSSSPHSSPNNFPQKMF